MTSLIAPSAVKHHHHFSPYKQKDDLSKDKVVCGNSEKIAKELGRLARLDHLHRAILQFERPEKLKQLQAFWVKTAEELVCDDPSKSVEKIKTVAASIKAELPKFDKRIASVYLPLISEAGLHKQVRAFSKDPVRIGFGSPLFAPNGCFEGPTLLVRYHQPPKIKTQKLEDEFRRSVVKLSHPNERAANFLYRVLSESFVGKGACYGFSIPMTSWLCLSSNPPTHENFNGEITELPVHRQKAIVTDFKSIAKRLDPDFDKEISDLMIAERIQGRGLHDYLSTTYQELSEQQRIKFFERLGRLALIDLLIGNFDRLLQIYRDSDGTFMLDSALESNLANILVVPLKKDPFPFYFYAIDNSMNRDLLTDENGARKSYNEFIQSLFKSENPFDQLAENIVICMVGFIKRDAEESFPAEEQKGEINSVSNEEILKDLKKGALAFSALKSGLEYMAYSLYEETLPKHWGEFLEGGSSVYLAKISPDFSEAVKGQFNTFLTQVKL